MASTSRGRKSRGRGTLPRVSPLWLASFRYSPETYLLTDLPRPLACQISFHALGTFTARLSRIQPKFSIDSSASVGGREFLFSTDGWFCRLYDHPCLFRPFSRSDIASEFFAGYAGSGYPTYVPDGEGRVAGATGVYRSRGFLRKAASVGG